MLRQTGLQFSDYLSNRLLSIKQASRDPMSSAAAKGAQQLGRRAKSAREVQTGTRIREDRKACSYYWDTAAPSREQLEQAEKFFSKAPPTLLFSSTEFRRVQTSELPEVAFLGRSNVGKSSILNALMGRQICHTSSKPGRTRSMNFFAVGGADGQGSAGKLVVLDLPGYGHGSREAWGSEIMKYLKGREQYAGASIKSQKSTKD